MLIGAHTNTYWRKEMIRNAGKGEAAVSRDVIACHSGKLGSCDVASSGSVAK